MSNQLSCGNWNRRRNNLNYKGFYETEKSERNRHQKNLELAFKVPPFKIDMIFKNVPFKQRSGLQPRHETDFTPMNTAGL